jgi:hypothetical protein
MLKSWVLRMAGGLVIVQAMGGIQSYLFALLTGFSASRANCLPRVRFVDGWLVRMPMGSTAVIACDRSQVGGAQSARRQGRDQVVQVLGRSSDPQDRELAQDDNF